jgi:transcriptional regulator with XRE-family HTH domain
MDEDDQMSPAEVGLRLKSLREGAGLTGAYVAAQIQMDQSNYSKVEAGVIKLQVACAIVLCDMYGVNLDYIYRGVTKR